MTVTFFGHRNVSDIVRNKVENTIRHLIEVKGATVFYVGNNGNFDFIVAEILRKLSNTYPQIEYSIVLAYMPTKKRTEDTMHTIFPEEVAVCIPKFAIDKRNRWMLDKSDCVVAYITHKYGGASKYFSRAVKQGKEVINIVEI